MSLAICKVCLSLSALRWASALSNDFSRRHLCQNPPALEGGCLRKYTAPTRGSKSWMEIFKRRTAVERVNVYHKGYFQMNNVRYRTGKRAKVHFDLVTLVYNASKLAADCMNAMLKQQVA